MKLLILGGTVFLGRHIAEAAIERGHEVTLFNRGKHHPELFPELEKIHGDRDGELSALEGRKWDAVIDTSGYVPRVVGHSAELLKDAVDHYTFISSISVYKEFADVHMDESGPVATLENESVEEVNGETYGPLKALCEQVVQETMPNQALIVRPGLIVGPYDPTDRFTYWPDRVARGGEILVAEKPEAQVQFIDARDLAEWILTMVESKKTGTYNASGQAEKLTMKDLLESCQESLADNDSKLTWVTQDYLAENEVQPWMELPLWIPESEGMPGFMRVDCSKAVRDGLVYRGLDETVRETHEWSQTRSSDYVWKAGLDKEKEKKLLQGWHQLKSASK